MNLVLALLVLGGSVSAVWGGITDPEGGVIAGLGRAMRGEGQTRRAVRPSAFLASLLDNGGGGGATPVSYSGTTGATGDAATVIAKAGEFLGVPYKWGGASRSGMDCSGLTMVAYAAAGVRLPHHSATQATMGRKVSAAQARPGDLVAIGAVVHHVGIYLGGGKMRHAPKRGDVVKDSAIWKGEPVQYRRLLGTPSKGVQV